MLLVISFIIGAVVLAVLLYWFETAKTTIWYTDRAIIAAYAKDVSVFKKIPEAVAYPRNTNEVVALVKEVQALRATNNKASLTVRAGGTCMSGGPLSDSYILDMTKYMTGIIVDPVQKTATVEMGVYFRDLEAAAAKHGLMFAPYPSSRLICGIGGMIGNNASGEKSIRYGATGDNIISLEVVLADGTVSQVTSSRLDEVADERELAVLALAKEYTKKLTMASGEVRKSASGYKLEKTLVDDTFSAVPLFAGAQGTLGIITKAVLRLVPIPEHLSLLVVSASKLEDIPIIVSEIHKHNPEAIETLDKNTFARAKQYLKNQAEIMAPYVLPDAELFILAEFSEASKEETEARARACSEALLQAGYVVRIVTDPSHFASIWEVRRNSFLLMRDHNEPGFAAVPCIEDVIVPVPKLAEFVGELHKILDRRGIQYGFHGHIGEGSLRIVPIFDTRKDTLFTDITGLMTEVFAVIKRLKGNISADHSDGIIRSPFLREFYGEDLYQVFVRIKELYDPSGLMNPGKKINVAKTDIETYFDRT